MAFLEVKNLYKNYGETQVLKGVSFDMTVMVEGDEDDDE